MSSAASTIAPEERTVSALTHLSGLSGYLIPLGGVLVPIVIWLAKRDSRVISRIALQAILLNVAVWIVIVAVMVIWIVLDQALVLLLWLVVALAAVALPIVGAIRAGEGRYYRYPFVGLDLDERRAP